MQSADAIEEKLQKQIVEFFSFFEDFSFTINSSCEQSRHAARSLVSLLRRFRLIRGATLQVSLLAEARDALLLQLDSLVSEHVSHIRAELDNLNELHVKLSNKYNNLQNSCKQIYFSQDSALVRGSCCQPPLARLLEYAHDAVNFSFQVCSQLDIALEKFSLDGSDTSDAIVGSFEVQKEWKVRIAEINRYTSHCSENEL